ncbi:MAG: TolC family protein [Ignavibacteria bacterium]|jgi:outer membrane protein TolC|nr:TolC family protein [Ignavibacteria bacterium]MCU7503327.1 TolC family protein [Ignavibacteria bacterium]MCU7515727.1 TolC family protein [Ignavibacteria bacterium]
MKKLLLLNLLILPAMLFAQTQKLTLEESIETGLKNSKDLRISMSRTVSANAKVTEANSQLLPQLKFLAGYTRLSSVPPFEVTMPGVPFPIKISDVILNNYAFRLSLQQPVFTGLRLTSLKSAAEFNNQAAESDYSKDVNEASFKIQSAFWQLYKAGQMLNLLNENLLQNERHLEDTKNNLANGLVTQNDVLKLEVLYSNTKLQQIEAQNNLDIARMAFNQALGLQLNAPTEIDAGNIDTTLTAYRYNEIIKEAKEKRNELKAMRSRLEASNEGLRAARSLWFPSVFLNANYYYNRPNQRIQPPKDAFRDTWDIGVTLNWDLWNWGYNSSQTSQAEQTRLQAETSLEELNDAIELEVYSNYLTYERSSQKITVSRQSLGQAQENYRIISDKYNVQLATSTDLIDAETAVLQAQTNYNNALVDYEIAKTRLEKSLGRRIY